MDEALAANADCLAVELLLSGSSQANIAAEFTRLLKAANKEQALRILGTAPIPLAHIKGEHRLIKTKNRRVAHKALDAAMLALREQAWDLRMLNVEVDLVSLV